MSTSVPIAKAKAEFAAIVARAESGEEIIITRNGRAVARLLPVAAGQLVFGDLGDVTLPDDLSLPEVVADFYPGGDA